MGVDLHLVREKRTSEGTEPGQWETAEQWHDEDGHLFPSGQFHVHNKVLMKVLAGDAMQGLEVRGYPVDVCEQSLGWVKMWGDRAAPFDHTFLLLEELRDISRFVNEGKVVGQSYTLPFGYSVIHDAMQETTNLYFPESGRAEYEVNGWVKKEKFEKFERGGSVDYSLIYPLSSFVSPSIQRSYVKVQGSVPLWFIVRDDLNKLIKWVSEAGDDTRVVMLKTN